MNTYKTFEEKELYFKFGGLKINTNKNFDYYTNLLMLQYSKEDFIFRGLPEAKYKLFNSAQRNWFQIASEETYQNEEMYDDYIISLMSECKKWNSGTVPNLLKTYGISDKNSIAFLSFMQHFELPTPLIDFTKNPNNAIFFAIDSIPDDFNESDIEIDNYFSIYYTFQNNTSYEIFKSVFDKNRTNIKIGEFDYEDLTKNGILLISDKNIEFSILNNIRIANQEGLFFYNNSPFMAIEEQYKGFADMLLEKVGEKKFKELLVLETFSGCLNFHKKYAKHIKRILPDLGISKEFMYPDINDLKEHVRKLTHKA
jgi:hypothetical protein